MDWLVEMLSPYTVYAAAIAATYLVLGGASLLSQGPVTTALVFLTLLLSVIYPFVEPGFFRARPEQALRDISLFVFEHVEKTKPIFNQALGVVSRSVFDLVEIVGTRIPPQCRSVDYCCRVAVSQGLSFMVLFCARDILGNRCSFVVMVLLFGFFIQPRLPSGLERLSTRKDESSPDQARDAWQGERTLRRFNGDFTRSKCAETPRPTPLLLTWPRDHEGQKAKAKQRALGQVTLEQFTIRLMVILLTLREGKKQRKDMHCESQQRRYPSPLLLTWPKGNEDAEEAKCLSQLSWLLPSLRIFVGMEIRFWLSLKLSSLPRISIADWIIGIDSRGKGFDYTNLAVTQVNPVEPHQEDKYGNYNPSSRLLAARGMSALPKITLPKARCTIYGFKRLPSHLVWEAVYHHVQGALLINAKTMKAFSNESVLKLLGNLLEDEKTFSMSNFAAARRELKVMAMNRSWLDLLPFVNDGSSEEEWEYINDEFIATEIVQTMFKRDDAVAPLFADTLVRMQEMFWVENRTLPDEEELKQIVGGAFTVNKSYMKMHIAASKRRGWSPERDDITQWEHLRDDDYEYFEVNDDNEECEDPEAPAGSDNEEDDGSDDASTVPEGPITEFCHNLRQLPGPDQDERVSELHQDITQKKVDSIFKWIVTNLKSNGASTGSFIIGSKYSTIEGENASFDRRECREQWRRANAELNAAEPFVQYLHPWALDFDEWDVSVLPDLFNPRSDINGPESVLSAQVDYHDTVAESSAASETDETPDVESLNGNTAQESEEDKSALDQQTSEFAVSANEETMITKEASRSNSGTTEDLTVAEEVVTVDYQEATLAQGSGTSAGNAETADASSHDTDNNRLNKNSGGEFNTVSAKSQHLSLHVLFKELQLISLQLTLQDEYINAWAPWKVCAQFRILMDELARRTKHWQDKDGNYTFKVDAVRHEPLTFNVRLISDEGSIEELQSRLAHFHQVYIAHGGTVSFGLCGSPTYSRPRNTPKLIFPPGGTLSFQPTTQTTDNPSAVDNFRGTSQTPNPALELS